MSTLEVKAIAAPAGFNLDMPAGHIIQSVHSNTGTQVNIATTTYTDIGLSAAITPQFSNSKILVIFNIQCNHNSDEGIGIKLLRDSTVIINESTQYASIYSGSGGDTVNRSGYSYLDSPSTTSAITYKVQAGTYSGRQIGMQVASGRSDMTLMEVSA